MIDEGVGNKRVVDENMESSEQEIQVGKKEENREKNQSPPRNVLLPSKPSPILPPLPLPQRFRKSKLDGKFATFFNMLKKLVVDIPFAEALAQMPNYVKFMKEIMSKKKKFDPYGTISLSENCSALIQRKLPENKRIQPVSPFLSRLMNILSRKLYVIWETILILCHY